MCSTELRTAKIPQTKTTTEATPARAATTCVRSRDTPQIQVFSPGSLQGWAQVFVFEFKILTREKVHGICQAYAQNGKADAPRKRQDGVWHMDLGLHRGRRV